MKGIRGLKNVSYSLHKQTLRRCTFWLRGRFLSQKDLDLSIAIVLSPISADLTRIMFVTCRHVGTRVCVVV